MMELLGLCVALSIVIEAFDFIEYKMGWRQPRPGEKVPPPKEKVMEYTKS